MINLDKKEINFVGHRKVFLVVSAVLMILSVVLLCTRGLNLSTDFTGGSTITYTNVAAELNEQNVRDAITEAGYEGSELTVQTMSSNGIEGFLARIDTTDVQQAEQFASASSEKLGVASEDVQTTTIGPNWGADVVESTLLALVAGMLLILAYIGIRFRNIKMGVIVIVTLLHDIVIILGVYAAVGFSVSPSAVGALCCIVGYSCYDSVVLFRSILDNSEKITEQSFWTVTNHSINQVLMRSLNTTITTLVPVVFMLVFGGTTLTEYAFAIAIGLVLGAYSSIAIACPLYAIWKGYELPIAKMNVRYGSVVNTDTADIMGYDRSPSDIPAYLEARAARNAERKGSKDSSKQAIAAGA